MNTPTYRIKSRGDYLVEVIENNTTVNVSLFFEYEILENLYLRIPPNANGRRTSMVSQDPTWGTGTHTYTYDAVGRLSAVSYPWGQSIAYTYDAAGNRLTETEGIYRKVYVYNEENHLTDLTTYATKPNIYPVHTWAWDYDAPR